MPITVSITNLEILAKVKKAKVIKTK